MTKKAPGATDRLVGSRIRQHRMQAGMSQEKLGEALGVTFQQVQKYEKGANRIGASRLQQIAETLNLPVGTFFEGAGSQPLALSDGVSPGRVTSPAGHDGLELNAAFMRIPNGRVRRQIIDLVISLAQEFDPAPTN